MFGSDAVGRIVTVKQPAKIGDDSQCNCRCQCHHALTPHGFDAHDAGADCI